MEPYAGTSALASLSVRRLPVRLESEDRRVIARPFGMGFTAGLNRVVEYARGLDDEELKEEIDGVLRNFHGRHEKIEDVFEEHYETAANARGLQQDLTRSQRLLVGAYLTMEYSIEAAALFNPSIVAHPDQRGVPDGGVRYVMSLRATGEGHVSSVVFRTGVIGVDGQFKLDPPPRFSSTAQLARDHEYLKWLFRRKLKEMGVNLQTADRVLEMLPDCFNFAQLESAIRAAREGDPTPRPSRQALNGMLWLARSNYQLQMPNDAEVSDIIIFPENDNEARGIEDVRLVRFIDDDDSVTWFGTYTAFDGYRILPMLIETSDFRSIEVHTLNGACAQNKGMALFPRRVNEHYCVCSRIDGQNLFIMYSDYIHFWEDARLLAEPKYPWELMLIGNCGSPLETSEGWLLLTHGVGPMRRYCIGAMLLDLEDPLKIIGRLKEPLLAPTESEREGYVPNVVYSCGSMIHGGLLYLPYAMSDKATSVATVELDELVDRLRHSPQ